MLGLHFVLGVSIAPVSVSLHHGVESVAAICVVWVRRFVLEFAWC
jgi:hypothetical protein